MYLALCDGGILWARHQLLLGRVDVEAPHTCDVAKNPRQLWIAPDQHQSTPRAPRRASRTVLKRVLYVAT